MSVASLPFSPAAAAAPSPFLTFSSLTVFTTSTFPLLTLSLLAGVCTRGSLSPPPPITPRPTRAPATAPPMTTSRRTRPPTRRGVRPPPEPPPSPSIRFLNLSPFS